MRIQSNLGSDIAMAFDECVENPAPYKYAKDSCERTLRWLERCKAEHDKLNSLPDTVNPGQMLFGINQGATFEDLRIWHMKEIAKIDCDGYAIGGLAVGVLVGNVCLKNLIARPRPCWLDSSVRLLIADPTDYSFPSGHTLSSVIGATILTKTDRRFGYAAIPLAALIAFSRLYLYVHFPSDVLAAAVPGVMIGELAFYADRRWTERKGT